MHNTTAHRNADGTMSRSSRLSAAFLALVLLSFAALMPPRASAFSLLGPFTSWQVIGLGYAFPEDIGGPMNVGEGFRWNVPVVTYACDKSFLDYFGPKGVAAIDQAMSYFNGLDPFTKMSPDLSEYSTSTIRENYEAATLGLIDLKSTAMWMVIEEMGLTDPVRYTFTLRSRRVDTTGNPNFTNYVTIMRNFDPVTLQPSRYVNGVLLTYANQEFRGPPADYADAIESTVGQLTFNGTAPVATGILAPGFYRIGLTRDDVGGLRYLYNRNNIAVETLLPTVTGNIFGSTGGWIPFSGLTNGTQVTNTLFLTGTNATNLIVVTGPRGGRKPHFQRVFFDSLIGQTFQPITNQYTDVTIGSNFTMVVQAVQRGITQPDIVFVAEDVGLDRNAIPYFIRRTGTTAWQDNDALNGIDETALSHGPGVITPQVRISFSDQLPFFVTDNLFLENPGEGDSLTYGAWGSFDGSTNAPIIYPVRQNISVNQLRNQILHGGL